MRLASLILLFLMVSCSELIAPPKNLLSEKETAEMIAEMALIDQLNTYVPGTNIEDATRAVLKEQKITAKVFNDSYKYYMATGELAGILDDAQEIILDKDPAGAEYVQKKIKENQNSPAFAK